MDKNRIVLFCNIKGGVGKSTLSAMFASYLVEHGESVVVVDADVQSTLYRHRKRDKQEKPEEKIYWQVYSLYEKGLPTKEMISLIMDKMRQLKGWVIFDMPGNMQDDNYTSIYAGADGVVIPLTYEPDTLDATADLFVPIFRKHNPKAKLIFLPNKINEMYRKEKSMIDERREIAKAKLSKFGRVTPRIKQGTAVPLYSTVGLLNEFQTKAVKNTFNDIINELK